MMRTRQRLESIQSLRAVAALLVVAFHSGREAAHHAGPAGPALRALGESAAFGVDIFFVLSGFVMIHASAGRPTGPAAAGQFLARRIARVAPLYWLFTTLFLLPLLATPHMLYHPDYSGLYLLASYLFVPWPQPGGDILAPVLGIGWTLNYEMAFYLVFAGLIAAGVRRRLGWLALLLGLLAAAGFLIRAGPAPLFFWTRSPIVEFVLGGAVAALAARGARLPWPAGAALIAIGIGGWQFSAALVEMDDMALNLRGLLWGPAAMAIVAGVVFAAREPVAGRRAGGEAGALIHAIGDASYSLYLSHLFVIRIISIGLDRADMLGSRWVVIPINLLATTAAGLFVYRWIERPLIRFLTGPARGTGGIVTA